MAQPYDDRCSPQYAGSAVSSQTSLAANRAWAMTPSDQQYPTSQIYDDDGSMWKYKRSKKMGTKLAKIRSSPSHGALAAARASAGGRAHKRGNSASASQSPISPTLGGDPDPDPYGLKTPPSAYFDQHSITSPKVSVRGKVKIKPMLLRKLSSNDENAIDLSRSAAENEGLGIYNSVELGREERPSLDTSRAKQGYHHRSNSQISTTTTSSSHRYGTQYVHPMRQTPRPYTPPIATSYQHSLNTETRPFGTTSASTDTPHSESFIPQSPISAGTSSYVPLPSQRRQVRPLHVRTHSSSRLTSSSQTNLPGTPSSLRPQNDNDHTTDNMFTSARSSVETFRLRSRTNTSTNYAETAAIVAELRRKFEEKQDAKEAKYQEAALRQEAKEYAKRQKREGSEHRKSESKERKRTKSNVASEKTVIMGEHENAPTLSFIAGSPSGQGQRRRATTGASAGKAVHSQWQLFWFRFRMAWLRLKRMMGVK